MNPYPGDVLRRCGRWELIRDLGPCGRTRRYEAWDPLDEHFVTVVVLDGINALELIEGTEEIEAAVERWTAGRIPASTELLYFDHGDVGESAFIVLDSQPDDASHGDAQPSVDTDPPWDAPDLSFASTEGSGHTEAPPPAEPPPDADATANAPPLSFSFASDDAPRPTEVQPVAEAPADTAPSAETPPLLPEPDNARGDAEEGVDVGEPEFAETSESSGAETFVPASSAAPPRVERVPLQLGKSGSNTKTLIGVIIGAATGAVLLILAVRSILPRHEIETASLPPHAPATLEVAAPPAESTLAAVEIAPTQDPTTAHEQGAAPPAAPVVVAKAEVAFALQPTIGPSPAHEAVAVPPPLPNNPERAMRPNTGITPVVPAAEAAGSDSASRQNRAPGIKVNVPTPANRQADDSSTETLDRAAIHNKVESWLAEREYFDRRARATDVRYAVKEVQISRRDTRSAIVTVTYEINNPSDGEPGLRTVKLVATGQHKFWTLNPFLVE